MSDIIVKDDLNTDLLGLYGDDLIMHQGLRPHPALPDSNHIDLTNQRSFLDLVGLSPSDKEDFLTATCNCSKETQDASDEFCNFCGIEYDVVENTALHYAALLNNEQACSHLLNTISSTRIDQFLQARNSEGKTVLHLACQFGVCKLIMCLLSHATCEDVRDQLLLRPDGEENRTVLHMVADSGYADLCNCLLENVSEGRREEFLLLGNHKDRTALHIACEKGHDKVVELLLSYITDKAVYTLKEDTYGYIAIHICSNRNVAEKLLETLDEISREENLYEVNLYGATSLHLACAQARQDVVEYLVTIVKDKDNLLMTLDDDGNSILHYARTKETIDFLLTSATLETKIKLLNTKNNLGQTALHVNCNRNKIDIEKPHTDVLSRNLLTETLEEHFFTPDTNGNTPLLIAIDKGKVSVVSTILEIFEDIPESIKSLLEHRNDKQQNAFHLSCSHILFKLYYEIIEDYLDMIDISKVIQPDSYGNTPLHYALGTYNTPQFADHIMRFSLPMRRQLLLNTRNIRNLNGRDVTNLSSKTDSAEFFMRSLLNEDKSTIAVYFRFKIPNADRDMLRTRLQSSEGVLPYDPTTLTVMMLALNEYCLTNPASILLHTTTAALDDEVRCHQCNIRN